MFITILFDIILVGILLSGAFIGIKNGFIDTVARPVKFILRFVLAFSLAGIIGSFIIEPIIGPAISHKLSDTLIEEYSDITAETASEDLPTLVKLAAGMCGLSVDEIASGADAESVIEDVADAVTAPVVKVIGIILGFAIAYFLAKYLINFLMILVDNLVNRGIAGSVNKTLGCIFTLFLAFVVGWAFTSVFEFIFNIPAIADTKAIQNFNGGPIYNFFRSFTPLDLLLSF